MLPRMIPMAAVVIGLGGVLLAAPGVDAQTRTDRMTRIENGLTANNRSIVSRMQARRITGMSLVIVEGNAIRWRRGYGLRVAGDPNSRVTSSTVFDAASVSKPIAATAALRLVEQGRVSLTDTRILADIATRFLQPTERGPFALRQFERPGDIDLSRLLMHCAGVLAERQVDSLRLTGAQPFAVTASLPTMRQQLIGYSPAGSTFKPVQTSALRPGVRYRYGGASYMLVQAVIDRYAPNGFSGYTTELLRDLGMTRSTFAGAAAVRQSSLRGNNVFARGHIRGQTQAPLNYGNHAAASLVTSADDLARFLIMVNQRGVLDGKQVLSRTTLDILTGRHTNSRNRCANRTISSSLGTMAPGFRVTDNGTLHHRGTHAGYRAYIFARPGNSWAMAVLMTGRSEDADAFAAELFRTVESVYGFPAGSIVE